IDNYDNIRVYVPNSKVFAGEVQNLTTNGALKLELKVIVGFETDLAMARTVVTEIVERQPLRLTSHDIWVGYQGFGDSGIDMRAQMWVMPANVMNARSALVVEIKQAFDAAGIEIPYPHQVAVAKTAPA